MLKNVVGEALASSGRKANTPFVIVDALSVTDTALDKGYDADKKVSGIKRHIAGNQSQSRIVDICAFHQRFIVRAESFGRWRLSRPTQMVEEFLDATVQIAERSELHTFTVIPQRWVVERSFTRLKKCCRL